MEDGKFSVEMREGYQWGSSETHSLERAGDTEMTHPDLRLDLKRQQVPWGHR